jgi:hypothetical protein
VIQLLIPPHVDPPHADPMVVLVSIAVVIVPTKSLYARITSVKISWVKNFKPKISKIIPILINIFGF